MKRKKQTHKIGLKQVTVGENFLSWEIISRVKNIKIIPFVTTVLV